MSERRVTEVGRRGRGNRRGSNNNNNNNNGGSETNSPHRLSISERFGLIASRNSSSRQQINFKSHTNTSRGNSSRGRRGGMRNSNSRYGGNQNYRGNNRGRGGFRGGRGGRGRGGRRGGEGLSKESLDREIDNYNAQDEDKFRANLDQEMADYQSQGQQAQEQQNSTQQPLNN